MMEGIEARHQLIASALCFESEDAMLALAKLPQTEVAPFVVSVNLLDDVLTRFLTNKMSDDDLSFWATIVEQRSDIDATNIEGFVYSLSNDELMGGITIERITRMRQLLRSSID